jgi:hypothetical protein
VSRWFLALCLAVSLSGIVVLGYVFNGRVAAAREFERQARLSAEDASRVRTHTVLSTTRTAHSTSMTRSSVSLTPTPLPLSADAR